MLKSEPNDMGMCWPCCCMCSSALCDACSLSLSKWLSSTASRTIRRHNIFIYSQLLSKPLCVLCDTHIHSFYSGHFFCIHWPVGFYTSVWLCVSTHQVSSPHTTTVSLSPFNNERVIKLCCVEDGTRSNSIQLWRCLHICKLSHCVLLPLKSFLLFVR